MAATAAMVAELRRMINELDATTYDDDTLELYIERYPVLDVLGRDPQEISYLTSPPTLSEDSNWIPTYDLHAAAADIWQEKSATVAEDYNFTADGGTLARGDVQRHYQEQARFHLSRRKTKTTRLWVEPRITASEESNED